MSNTEIEERCFELNETLVKNFAKQFELTYEELKEKIIFVGRNDKVLNMVKQLEPLVKSNPDRTINFGEYGNNIAKELNVEPDYLFKSIIYCSCNDLLLNIAVQINNMFKMPSSVD